MLRIAITFLIFEELSIISIYIWLRSFTKIYSFRVSQGHQPEHFYLRPTKENGLLRLQFNDDQIKIF